MAVKAEPTSLLYFSGMSLNCSETPDSKLMTKHKDTVAKALYVYMDAYIYCCSDDI